MRLHPRTQLVSEAEADFTGVFAQWLGRHDLTYGEVLGILGRQVSNTAKYLVREERHPGDLNKKGDEE